MKILISAYACEPGRGSEPGVGWNVVREVSRYHQVWVLTSNCHRATIQTELTLNKITNLNFVYLDPFGLKIDWSSKGKWTQKWVHLHYYLWQIWAYFVSRSLHQEIDFDIVHHVTYVKYSSPSFLSLLPIPFIWGPVGGGESAPKKFWKDFSLRGKIYESIRNLARFVGEIDPFVRITVKKSGLIQATTEDTAKRLYKMGAKSVEIISESGLPEEDILSLSKYEIPDDYPVRFISMGRLLHWKGFHLGLCAFAQANLINSEYWILGDGSQKEQLYALAQELEIADKVKFWGRLPREQSLEKLRECHVLVHPSLHDSGGWVCMEAMAAGRAVICLDLGGPAVQVTEETGFKIHSDTPEQTVQDIAQAMVSLANNPEFRLRMGQAGQKRVRENFSWKSKGFYLSKLYREFSTNE
ncbi:MAG: glycosyltransferase family 4 protein [Cyanobacteria bacterium P01_H01_bin.150]